jgi:hypothetical protein
MPRYINPNNHPVCVSITDPRISITVYPLAWTKARLHPGARQHVELDPVLAKVFVQSRMLKLEEPHPLQKTPEPTPAANPDNLSPKTIAAIENGMAQSNAGQVTEMDFSKHVDPHDEAAHSPGHDENVTPAEMARKASQESSRIQVRARAAPSGPARKPRYRV